MMANCLDMGAQLLMSLYYSMPLSPVPSLECIMWKTHYCSIFNRTIGICTVLFTILRSCSKKNTRKSLEDSLDNRAALYKVKWLDEN